jgi:iron complex outermembrane receptor protein
VDVVGVQNASDDPILKQFTTVRPETSKGWEVGFKSAFLEDRARLNVAAYRQKYDGFIYLTPFVTYYGDQGGGATLTNFNFTTNVPANVKGVEAESSFLITQRWNVGLGFSYAKGRMDNATIPCNGPPIADAPGQRVALCTGDFAISAAPPWNVTLQSDYSVPITSALDGYVRGLLTYYPDNKYASGNGSGTLPSYTAAQYAVLNLYTGLRSSSGTWDVTFFAKNLTNSKETLRVDQIMEISPITGVNSTFGASGYFRTSIVPMREFGITATYAFGSR